jgi:hypothetical protein
MKLHIIKDQRKINYPVGYHIQNAINFVNNVTQVIMEMAKKKQFPLKNIDIWVRGSSGAILGGLLCQRLLAIGYENLSVIHIKKDGEESHTENIWKTGSKYHIVIDDFTASGETMDRIAEQAGKYIKYVNLLIVSKIALDAEYNGNDDSKIESLSLRHFVPKTLICGVINVAKKDLKYLRKLKPTNINKL